MNKDLRRSSCILPSFKCCIASFSPGLNLHPIITNIGMSNNYFSKKEVKRLKGIVNQNAKTKDPAAGARYIPREERIQHHYDNLDAARSKRRNVKFI